MAKFVDSLVKHFAAELKKQNVDDALLRLFFVRRRVERLEELHPDWTEAKVRDHSAADMDAIRTWLGAKAGRHRSLDRS